LRLLAPTQTICLASAQILSPDSDGGDRGRSLDCAPCLVARTLVESDIVLVASPANLARYGVPVAPQDLERHTLIAFSGSQKSIEWVIEPAEGNAVFRSKGG